MEDLNVPYRMPEGFNPYISIDAIRGLSDAIARFMFEGPGTARVIPVGDRMGFEGLIELLQTQAHALHAYLHDIENRTSITLPRSEADFEAMHIRNRRRDDDGVREAPAVYLVR